MDTDNKTADLVNSAIKTSSNLIVNVVQKMIIAEVPALGLPIVKQIWEALFNYIADKFTIAAEHGATFAVIDIQVGKEKTDMSKALAALIAAEKSGDKDAIQKAIQDYAKAHSALVHSDGSSTAQ